MSLSLRSRFLAAEKQFLSAFSDGADALDVFGESWNALLADFGVAKASLQIDAETLSIAQAIASRVVILAESLQFMDIEAKKVRQSLHTHCLELFSNPHDSSLSLSPSPSLPPSPLPEQLSPSSYCVGFDTPSLALNSVAIDWLVQNLQDPYPSAAVKGSVSQRCRCSVKDVQDWFADMRRQIGWTTLLREKFGGSRRLTSEAARRAYSKDGAADDLPVDIRRAFATVMSNARNLFANQSPPLYDSSNTVSHTMGCHPLPAASLPSSPILFTCDEDQDDIIPPPPIAGCKRRLDTSVEIEDDREVPSTARPSKRQRYVPLTTEPIVTTPPHYTTRSSAAVVPFSSSIVATSSTTEATERTSSVANPASTPTLVSTSPRKRRLSDAFAGNSPKRPRELIPAPRRQAVSDPLPISLNFAGSEMHALQEWFQSSFDIPYAAEVGGLDRSLSSDVEFAAFDAQSGEATFSTSLGPVSLASECYMSDADLVSATPEGFDFSAYNSDAVLESGFGFKPNSDVATSDGSSASSPSSAGSYLELSNYGLADNPSNQEWTPDWSQFLNIFDSLGSSPTSSQSSLSDLSCPCPPTSDSTSPPNPGDITHTLFGMEPSFTPSGLLSDIGGFSSLHMPLEAIF